MRVVRKLLIVQGLIPYFWIKHVIKSWVMLSDMSVQTPGQGLAQ